MAAKGILLFGGTFDPLHNGHLIIAREAAEKIGAAKVLLIPSARPPHKSDAKVTDPEIRLEMTRQGVADDDFFAVSDTELHREGPSYTLLTVRQLREEYESDVPLYWLIGTDTLVDLPNWYKVGELADACTIVTAARPGYEPGDLAGLKVSLSSEQIDKLRRQILETSRVEISATDIRRRQRERLSIRYLVPEGVREYIESKGLYI